MERQYFEKLADRELEWLSDQWRMWTSLSLKCRSHKGKADIQIGKTVLFCLIENKTNISDGSIAIFKKNIKAKAINR